MIVLHGPPKVGKSQLADKFPGKHLWLATEYGHRYIENRDFFYQLDPDEGWEKFKAVINSKLDKSIKTVVLDTTGEFYNIGMHYVCRKLNIEHPSDLPHGKGWNAVRTEVQNQVSKLAHRCQEIGATLICIDHSKEEEIVTTTEKARKINCAMPGQARSIIMPVPDHIWFLGYAEPDDNEKINPSDALKSKGARRALFLKGNLNIEAGTRDSKVKRGVIVPLSKTKPFEQIEKEMYQ